MTLLVEPPTEPRQLTQRTSPLGWLPWTALAITAGLLTVSFADALSRTGRAGGSLLFWLAVVLIVLPAGLRLCSDRVRPGERVATVVAVGMGLYAVKVLRDPFAFTYGDEFSHLHNLQSIVATGNLFGSNSILPITPGCRTTPRESRRSPPPGC
jgi:hypothetical protein